MVTFCRSDRPPVLQSEPVVHGASSSVLSYELETTATPAVTFTQFPVLSNVSGVRQIFDIG
jgi:hypothetical protein